MTEFAFPFWAVEHVLDGPLALAEAFAFPEVSRLQADRGRLRRALERNVRIIVEELPPADLHRRHPAAPLAVEELTVPLDPPTGTDAWRGPLPLRFDVLRWRHADVELALVPVLDVLAFARTPADLGDRLPGEVRAALTRLVGRLDLRRLAELQRITRVRVERLSVAVRLRSPKQRVLDARREAEDQPSVLSQVAVDLAQTPGPPAYEVEDQVGRLAELLTSRQPRSVLLVGPAGVGKTATIHELVRRRADFQLGATPFWATSGARLVAGMSGFGMWQERCHQVVREAAKRKAVLHLGNLVELMEVGKSEHNATGIAGFLRPYLARGDLLGVAECTPEQVPLVEREAPHLLDVFHTLEVAEPDEVRGRAILERAAEASGGRQPPGESDQGADAPRSPDLSPAALDTLDRLHRRYATYSAYPGRPLRFLYDLLRDHPADRPVTPADVYAAFTRETGLPRALLDPAEPLDLAVTRRWFADRVVGQSEAVGLVTDLIATAKAGLARPRKPIASLVFIGPTGVGKTEMAKALAEFLFGSKDRLTRFDMSEYADPVAVRRLVGANGGEGLLTAAVRERPFSVVLLDEFEKGHPDFLDLLLQVLGEGRLTDAAGRLADFRNSVVILTSNLGAESFRKGAYGFSSQGPPVATGGLSQHPPDDAVSKDHFTHEVQSFLRPELFNRIDRLVPFAPLAADTVTRIAERHLHRLEARDGIRYRGVGLTLGPDVADHLARHGFDPRYGARPLIRAVERELLAPLADALNRYTAGRALTADVRLDGDRLHVQVRARPDAGETNAPLAAAATACVALRRDVQRLEGCAVAREFYNDLTRTERDQERFEKTQRKYAARLTRAAAARPAKVKDLPAPRVRAADQDRLARLARLRQLADRLRDLGDRTTALEDDALQTVYADPGTTPADAAGFRDRAAELTRLFDDLLLTLACRRYDSPDAVVLGLYSEDRDWLAELTAAYLGAAAGVKATLLAFRLPDGLPPRKTTESGELAKEGEPQWRDDVLVLPATGRQPERALLTRGRIADPATFAANPPDRLVGIALGLRGPAAYLWFAAEDGLHTFRDPKRPQPIHCWVVATAGRVENVRPPSGISRRGVIGTQPVRRVYDARARLVADALLGDTRPWGGESLTDLLAAAVADKLRRDLRGLLDE